MSGGQGIEGRACHTDGDTGHEHRPQHHAVPHMGSGGRVQHEARVQHALILWRQCVQGHRAARPWCSNRALRDVRDDLNGYRLGRKEFMIQDVCPFCQHACIRCGLCVDLEDRAQSDQVSISCKSGPGLRFEIIYSTNQRNCPPDIMVIFNIRSIIANPIMSPASVITDKGIDLDDAWPVCGIEEQ